MLCLFKPTELKQTNTKSSIFLNFLKSNQTAVTSGPKIQNPKFKTEENDKLTYNPVRPADKTSKHLSA